MTDQLLSQMIDQSLTKVPETLKPTMLHQLQDEEVLTFLATRPAEFTAEQLAMGFSAINEFISQRELAKNGQVGRYAEMTPALAWDMGYIVVEYLPNEVKRIGQLTSLGVSQAALHSSLETFEPNQERGDAFTKSIEFVTAAKERQLPTRGLYVWGDYGVGKTYLIGALANALTQQGVDVIIAHWPTLIAELQARFNQGNEIYQRINELKRVPVLILDDMGAGSLSAWSRDDVLGAILEARMNNNLPMFFTSNFNPEQLTQNYLALTKTGDEPVKAQRLLQRILATAQTSQMGGTDRRPK